MRNPSGYGCVRKLSGNRRRPFVALAPSPVQPVERKLSDILFIKKYVPEEFFEQLCGYYIDDSGLTPVERKQKVIGYYETRAEAMIALAEYNKNPYDLDKANTTFEQIYNRLFEDKYSKMKSSSKSARTAAYAKFIGIKDKKIREINLNMLQSVIDANSELSKESQRNMITLCREVFDFAIKNDLCEKDYSQYLEVSSTKEKSEKIAFTPEEIKTIWDNVDWVYSIEGASPRNTMNGIKLVDAVLILLYTGLRITELLNVECEDVHFNEGYIDVKGTKTTNAQRFVPIADKIKPLIEKRLKTGNEYLISTTAGKQMIYVQFRPFFIKMCDEFGMTHTIHETRHSFATYALLCDMDKTSRGFIMGHAQGNITDDVYTDVKKLIPKLVREMKKYDPLKEFENN